MCKSGTATVKEHYYGIISEAQKNRPEVSCNSYQPGPAQNRTARRGAWGELSGPWVPHDIRDMVIDFIKGLSTRTEQRPL